MAQVLHGAGMPRLSSLTAICLSLSWWSVKQHAAHAFGQHKFLSASGISCGMDAFLKINKIYVKGYISYNEVIKSLDDRE